MENQHEAGSGCSSSDLFSDLFRVDAEIRKMRHALLIANRLKDGGLWKPENDGELRELRKNLTAALLERSKLDERISSQNADVEARPDGAPNPTGGR